MTLNQYIVFDVERDAKKLSTSSGRSVLIRIWIRNIYEMCIYHCQIKVNHGNIFP